jgi:hypothetical protein
MRSPGLLLTQLYVMQLARVNSHSTDSRRKGYHSGVDIDPLATELIFQTQISVAYLQQMGVF